MALGAVRAEQVDVPYEGTTIPAWFVRALGHETRGARASWSAAAGTRRWSRTTSASAWPRCERGYHVLLHDGPGQGQLLIDEGLTLRHDWEHVVTPVVDAALAIDVVDPDRIVYEPWSLGGYMAPRVAAYEHRLAAVIADPGQLDIGGKITGPMAAMWPERRRHRPAAGAVGRGREGHHACSTATAALHWKIVQRGFWTNGAGDLRGGSRR